MSLIFGVMMSFPSTENRVFHLNVGQASTNLARDRLWQVKWGKGLIRILIDGVVQGEMPVPENGWFVVPESKHLTVQLAAITKLAFESRLPLALVPRLGDLGRQELIKPIRQLLKVSEVNDDLIDWAVKLAQPTFKAWFGESLDRAISARQPMSPDIATPLIVDQTPRTILEHETIVPKERVLAVLLMVGLLSIAGVMSWFGALVALESEAFLLTHEYPFVVGGFLLWIALLLGCIQRLSSHFKNVLPVGLSAGFLTLILLLMIQSWIHALSVIMIFLLISVTYWIYIYRLLPDLPSIDEPMRWLKMRINRDGVPSVRERTLNAWREATHWVIAQIELVAEYSRFSRAIMAGSLVIPAEAITHLERPIVLSGLSLAALILIERLRVMMPVGFDDRPVIPALKQGQPLRVGGSVQYEQIVYRRHAGDKPLFNQLSFHCSDDSLVRISAAEGAGLSTLKYLLIRQISPERGMVSIGGMDVARLDPGILALSIIMLDHPADGSAMTVGDWLFIEPEIQASTLDRHLRALSCHHWIEGLNNRLNSPMGALQMLAGPHGMNRLKLARALSRQGRILWLDHWLLGLDISCREHVINSLLARSGIRFVVDRDSFLKGRASVHWEISHD